jgi:DNA-binding transcriptional MerR regulator
MRNPLGNLDALANIGPVDLLMDEMVRKLSGYAEDLSAELARFQSHAYADIAGFDALLAQEYNVLRPEGRKGNRTFTTYDGSLKVKVCVSDRQSFGPELQQAKQLLDEMIQDRATGADPFLVTLVNQAFKVDKEGQVDAASILALRRLEVDDPRWADVCRAIDKSKRPQGSKSYLRFYKRQGQDGRDVMIPLDLAAVEPTPDAFARRSLRRQVEELQAQIAELTAARNGTTCEQLRALIDEAHPLALTAYAMDQTPNTDLLVESLTNADVALGSIQAEARAMPAPTKRDLLRQMLAKAEALAEQIHDENPTDETNVLTDSLKVAVMALDTIVADAAE